MEILQDKLKSILIVENEMVFSAIAKHIVKFLVNDAHIVQLEDLDAAVVQLAVNQFDLLILDVSFQTYNCTPAYIFSLKKVYPDLKVILVSTLNLPNEQAYLSNGVGYVVKKSGNIKAELSAAILAVFEVQVS